MLGHLPLDEPLYFSCANRLFEGFPLTLMRFNCLSQSRGDVLYLFLNVQEEVRDINLKESLSFFDLGDA